MNRAGIALYPWAVEHANHVCNDVWGGIHPDDVVTEFQGINPSWTYDQVRAFVAVSIVVYCPPPDLQERINGRVGGTMQA